MAKTPLELNLIADTLIRLLEEQNLTIDEVMFIINAMQSYSLRVMISIEAKHFFEVPKKFAVAS